jgi:prepilin peptidase CpaA
VDVENGRHCRDGGTRGVRATALEHEVSMIVTVLLLGLVGAAAAIDIATKKVFNWITYPGIIAAIVLHGAGSLAVGFAGVSPERLADFGWIGIGQSLAGFLLCGAVLMVCFVLFEVGGGDVKLMAMVGALLGPEKGIETMLWTFVLGACLGVITLIWRVGPIRLIVATWRHLLWIVRLARLNPLTPQEREFLRPPLFLAPSALLAAVIVQFSLVERFMGRPLI